MNVKQAIIALTNKVPFGFRSAIKNIPVLKQLQAFIIKKWLSKSDFVTTISGGPAKDLVFPVQMPQDKLMWIGTWELEFAEALQKAIRPGWVCYDIGAYKGYYAGVMALKGAKEVYIFEPMPANAGKIRTLISLNPTLPLHLKELAVSEKSGFAEFSIMPEETMGKLNASSFQYDAKSRRVVAVQTASLDELIDTGLPEADFIKIDVEGAEELVLLGAHRLMTKRKPYLMIEIHSHDIGKRCMQLLQSNYLSIRVLETGRAPGQGEADICHYIACNR